MYKVIVWRTKIKIRIELEIQWDIWYWIAYNTMIKLNVQFTIILFRYLAMRTKIRDVHTQSPKEFFLPFHRQTNEEEKKTCFNENNKSWANNSIRKLTGSFDRFILIACSRSLTGHLLIIIIIIVSFRLFVRCFCLLLLFFSLYSINLLSALLIAVKIFPTAPPVYLWHCFYKRAVYLCFCALLLLLLLPQCFAFKLSHDNSHSTKSSCSIPQLHIFSCCVYRAKEIFIFSAFYVPFVNNMDFCVIRKIVATEWFMTNAYCTHVCSPRHTFNKRMEQKRTEWFNNRKWLLKVQRWRWYI